MTWVKLRGVRPNNSFKPTPHRGVNSVLYATLHAVATPLRGGLTQALGHSGSMQQTPYLDHEIKQPFGSPMFRWVFARGASGLAGESEGGKKQYIFIRLADEYDRVMWEPKHVIPLLAKFSPEVVPNIDSWGLKVSAQVFSEFLVQIDQIIRDKQFYGPAA